MTAVSLLFTERVHVLTPGTRTNRAGAVTHDWTATPTNHGLYPAAIQGLTGVEELDEGRDAAVAKYRVYMPPSVPVTRSARLSWGGRTLEVVGIPRIVYSLLSGDPHHLEIDAKEAVG